MLKNILVVEDEPASLKLLSHFLRKEILGSDFYKLTIWIHLDMDLRHGAPSPTICRGGSLSRDCAR